jgi:hypothetical protein
MTEVGANDAGGTDVGPNPESERLRGKRQSRSEQSDDIPGGGRIPIGRSSIAQTIVAVAFLVLVTLVSFAAVSLIGEITAPTQLTYWEIELMFALLCGGAGALVGGSAAVRSTLGIPGSPVHATLGGAISMVIVGFALAYLGRPPAEEPMYALDIHNVPYTKTIGDHEYSVFVGPVESNLSFSRERGKVSIKIPPEVGTHWLRIAIYRPVEKDLSRTFARCDLSFETLDSQHTGATPMELVPGKNVPQFHLFFSDHYIERVVNASLQRNASITNEPCVEGRVATKTEPTPLDGRFTVQPNSVSIRALGLARLSLPPRYSILARDRANIDPQDTLPDLPPQTRPVPGTTALPSSSAAPEPEARRQVDAPAVPAARDTGRAKAKRPLTEEVDAYIRGEDHERTQLYQSWGEVADYVVRGLRDEFAKDSKLVAPYLNLIANALNTIDEGKYLPPTLRPDWDQSVKPDRLSKNQDIPGFNPNDYKIVVDSLCSTDEDVRRAAQRLLKLYPSSHFYAHLRALPKQPNFEKCRVAFISETAAYYFYNRIVEYDGNFTLDKQSRAWVNENHVEGREWVKRGEAQDGSLGAFTAMLDYARGLVLWDHGEKNEALVSFNQMIDSIRGSSRNYPSNPQHIATALRLIHDPERSFKPVQAAAIFNSPERRPVSRAYVLSDGGVNLYALPDSSAKQVGKMKPDATARIYLRLANWDLLEGGSLIGWARRVVASVAN